MARMGISPLIAVVLLVAVAISVGIMVTTWITHWVTSQTASSDIACAVETNYIIDEAKFNESGNNMLYIKITNKNSRPLYGFGVVMDNGTKIVTFNSSSTYVDQSSISSTNKLNREHSIYITVTLNDTSLAYPSFGASIDKLRVLNDACDAVSARTTDIITYG